jgi:hypothetical protein
MLPAFTSVHNAAVAVNLRDVRAKIPHCLDDSLFDCKARLPTEHSNATAIEKNEWVVPTPSAWAAAILETRGATEFRTDPTDGLVNLAVFICPKIENIDHSLGMLQCCLDGVDAILNVQIGFPL